MLKLEWRQQKPRNRMTIRPSFMGIVLFKATVPVILSIFWNELLYPAFKIFPIMPSTGALQNVVTECTVVAAVLSSKMVWWLDYYLQLPIILCSLSPVLSPPPSHSRSTFKRSTSSVWFWDFGNMIILARKANRHSVKCILRTGDVHTEEQQIK